MRHDIPFHFRRNRDDGLTTSIAKLSPFQCEQAAMINTEQLPKTPEPASFAAQPFEKTSMGSATAPQNILVQ
jgi:hypothetical protein